VPTVRFWRVRAAIVSNERLGFDTKTPRSPAGHHGHERQS
jgi:hypothetical protein